MDRLSAEFQCAVVGFLRILDAERHAAHGWAVFGGEVRRDAVRFVVEDQVDCALTVQVHVLGAVGRDFGEAHDLEDRLQGARHRRCELNEFKAHQAHWVFV
ncbi:hypothetical protein D3C87_1748410 [compost metagenome]